MAFDQSTRNRLSKLVQDTRTRLVKEFTRQLQQEYGMDPATGAITDLERLTQLDDAGRQTAQILRNTLTYYLGADTVKEGKSGRQVRIAVLDRIIREQAFTILNRLCALRMAEARGFLIESVAQGYRSRGFLPYHHLAGPALGETGETYRAYLLSLFDEFAADLPVLFDRFSPEGRLFPDESALLDLLAEINHQDLTHLWGEDETIGWIYQYFNSKEERKTMREESQAPRNGRELAVRNQFFTPRYVVEFLTDNTLGRIWYEMTQGQTHLVDRCRYLVRRPTEIFLAPGEEPPVRDDADDADLTQEELLRQPIYIPFRPLKDPRELLMLDPACGSMHFGLYAFDLYEAIYLEAWDMQTNDEWHNAQSSTFNLLIEDYPTMEDLRRDLPRLIIEHNIHGIDIDPRAVQIAGLSIWLRAQRAWQEQGLPPARRPTIRRSNIVCAEPMPGDEAQLHEFLTGLRAERLQSLIRRVIPIPPEKRIRATPTMAAALSELITTVWREMELAGEAGSLLKIEESLAAAIDNARQEWQVNLPLFRVETDYLTEDEGIETKVTYPRGMPDGRTDFWESAEKLVLAALQEYAEQAHNGSGYMRRLFAADAAQGFAFIDLCRKNYDAVLMNPPFGSSTGKAFQMQKRAYSDTYVDLYACFVRRGLELSRAGLVGSITSRAFLMTKKLARWRSNQLSDCISLILDLGSGVMDDAFVEAAAYISQQGVAPSSVIGIDRRDESEKDSEVDLFHDQRVHVVRRSEIKTLPGHNLLYQVSQSVFSLLRDRYVFEPRIGTAREGLRTFDDFRFLRLRWEVEPKFIGAINFWEPFAKGGEYSQYYSDIHLVIKWNQNGNELAEVNRNTNGQVAQSRQASTYYRRPGATYSKRSVKGFSARALPAGCIIGTKGPAVLSESDIAPEYLVGWLNSNLIVDLIHLQANAYEFNTGIIKRMPWRTLSDGQMLEALTLDAINMTRNTRIESETNSLFSGLNIAKSLKIMARNRQELAAQAEDVKARCQSEWDRQICLAYGVSSLGFISGEDDDIDGDEDENDDDISVTSDELELIVSQAVLSYALGCTFGRWDIDGEPAEIAIGMLPGPFELLPTCPPRMLQNSSSMPAASQDLRPDYPLRISWVGILTDDSGHPEDTVGRVREALAVIWSDNYAAIEHEACDILGVDSLRTYFANPNKFFDDHLKRYSKSRRYAPIYWPLSTPSGSYTLWLYYHRLDDQILYTCVNDFVDPKLELVKDDIAKLRRIDGRTPDQEEKLAELVDFALELDDFRKELLRIATFWRPNLNDGVQITAAPLWSLFQHRAWQKRLKDTWEQLEAGDYDWSHLAMSIWPARVVPQCTEDRSLAIAHDLEDLFWVEDDVDGWRPLQAPDEEIARQRTRWAERLTERQRTRIFAALEELAAGRGHSLPATQIAQQLNSGAWDDTELALLFWPERIAKKCLDDQLFANQLRLNLPEKRTKTARKRWTNQLVEAGVPDLVDALTATLDTDQPFDQLVADLAAGRLDDAPIALPLWPDRVINAVLDNHKIAQAHGLSKYFWTDHPAGAWRRRLSPFTEIQQEIARRS
ncbi:MAG: BREX-1 system adenine-specific DNA-methyltransferase PglX [Caldilineaceae bacterium]|nr:BREX-1 system adenine-specific DNA-methyltransferase PglX [Caldilineaceae bacterium]MCB9140466.1 BREX-1 system adenine-specific DNA-methyltransferase PglX [Caldilineaceae bacterium]